MRICFLAGANSIHSYRWIKYFIDKGYEIHWISLPSVYIREVRGAKVYLIKDFFCKPLNIILNILSVRRLIRKINPDILHVHYAGVNGILGALSGFYPFLLTAYGSDIFENSKSIIRRYLLKYVLRKADVITCNGKPLAKEMIRLGVDPQKIRFIYWGTDTKKFSPVPKDKELRKKLGAFDNPMIISLRNLEPVYDIETLIKAAPFILKEFPMAKLVITGEGSQEKNLKKLANELRISDSVNFVGWISYDDVPRYLNSSDVYVSTSLSDGDLAQSTQQAMACEIPIITTDINVNKERINDGEDGLLFPTGNSKSLAEKIIKLLKDTRLRIKLGKNGRKIIKKKLDYYKNMEEADKLYKELIKNYERK
jgi:glycosyltransferase involved in cell wall biosynthesis